MYLQRTRAQLATVAILCAVAATLCLTPSTVWSAPGQATPLTQQKINEIAAALLASHLEIEGVQTARIATETDAAYRKRLDGYAESMARAERSVVSLREPVIVRDSGSQNTSRWTRIRNTATQLPSQVAAYRKLLHSPGSAAALEAAFVAARKTIWTIYSELRDARP